jgi:plasmid stability protein
MPVVYVRGIPDKLYNRLKERAEKERRSLSAEVITLMDKALSGGDDVEQQMAVLERLTAIRRSTPPVIMGVDDSVTLIREDRDR